MPEAEFKPSAHSAGKSLIPSDLEKSNVSAKTGRLSRVVSAAMIVTIGLISVGVVSVICSLATHFLLLRRITRTSSIGGVAYDTSPLYINLALDTRAVSVCDKPLRDDSRTPCMMDRLYFTGHSESEKASTGPEETFPIGPMACRDDAYEQLGSGPDNCKKNAFELVNRGTGVLIPEPGVYRVHARLTYLDKVDYYVSTSIQVTPENCGPECWAPSRTWLSCFSHSRRPQQSNSSTRASGQFSVCTIDGVRRFKRGDVVSLQTSQPFRSISPYHKLTNMVVHRL